jgi:hypothetical protein
MLQPGDDKSAADGRLKPKDYDRELAGLHVELEACRLPKIAGLDEPNKS